MASPLPPVPVEELAASPMTPDVAAPADAGNFMVDLDQALPIAGAAGLALLAFAGIGLALRRRRRRNADMEEQNLSYRDWHEWHEREPAVARANAGPGPVAEHAPQAARASKVAVPAMGWTTPSAFNWGKTPSAPAATMSATSNESRLDAAYRGPTPDNPFLSLKRRLRRAAFFDQRERAVREGIAKPVPPMAGLPKTLADKTAGPTRGGNVTARPQHVPA